MSAYTVPFTAADLQTPRTARARQPAPSRDRSPQSSSIDDMP